MDILEYLKSNILYLDGGTGTVLQSRGLKPGEPPESWNITHQAVLKELHKAYFDAGSNVVAANTFGANPLKYSPAELEKMIAAAMNAAIAAKNESKAGQQKYVALNIGSCGKLLKPFGDLDFEDAVAAFAETVKLGVKYGAELVLIETMNDSYETKAAVLAAKENCNLPLFVSNAYGADGKLLTGASPAVMAAMLEGLGVDALGANCSLGADGLLSVTKELVECASVPIIFKPNAGMPKMIDERSFFDVLPEDFAADAVKAVKLGTRIIGGCCGTTPEFISKIVAATKDLAPAPIEIKHNTVVTSYSRTVTFGANPVLIGERINPTGKKRLKQALRDGDIDYVLSEGVAEQDCGAEVLDVNVGTPEIDEVAVLENVVRELQTVTDLPLQIDTANVTAMEKAIRRYNGKPLVNSVNGKAESMAAVFPIVKKYGGVVIALTLDENGIPETADGRVEIAKKIIKEAEKFSIDKKDLIFDPLTLTVSADKNAALVTLEALKRIKTELGCHTSLGVSNVSFGLPDRDAVNGAFFAAALENGLSAAIMNPFSDEMMKTYYAYRTLHSLDDNCADYIAFATSEKHLNAKANIVQTVAQTANNTVADAADAYSALKTAIIKGFKKQASKATAELLTDTAALDAVNNAVIPALDEVGRRYENKTAYLPQLLMSAEAAKSAFEVIKSKLSTSGDKIEKCSFVIATVEGDIHDIGKNIVKLLLENYGYKVCDLGRDVPPEVIADKVVELHSPLCGLSALMTTTLPAMKRTVELVHKVAPYCKVVVGGAVLTKEYAASINADKYAADAMETVRYADSVYLQSNKSCNK